MLLHTVHYSSHCVLRIKAKKCAEVLKIRIPTTFYSKLTVFTTSCW